MMQKRRGGCETGLRFGSGRRDTAEVADVAVGGETALDEGVVPKGCGQSCELIVVGDEYLCRIGEENGQGHGTLREAGVTRLRGKERRDERVEANFPSLQLDPRHDPAAPPPVAQREAHVGE